MSISTLAAIHCCSTDQQQQKKPENKTQTKLFLSFLQLIYYLSQRRRQLDMVAHSFTTDVFQSETRKLPQLGEKKYIVILVVYIEILRKQ